MGIRLNKLGGTDFTEEGLKPTTDLVPTLNTLAPTLFADNVGGNYSTPIGTTGAETDLSVITITQDATGDNGILQIIAGLRHFHNQNSSSTQGSSSTTFKLYINGVVKRTIVLSESGDDSDDDDTTAATLTFLETGVDTSTGSIIIKITGQTSTNSVALASTFCDGMIVTAYERYI